MANYTNLNDLFTDMANAIRAKKNSTDVITADNFPTEIENLKTGFDYINTDVVNIPDYAFYGCEDLKSVDCYNLTSVGESAFENCKNLKAVILYDGVESVGENAFKGCNCIIYYKGESIPNTWHENWNPDDCVVLIGDLVETWDVSATSNDNVTAELYGTDTNYILFISGNGNMKNYASSSSPWYNSYRQNITHVIINTGVTSIGNYTFYGCKGLTSINIPDSITSIGNYAFDGCRDLTSITIPDSVTSIGNMAFYGCTGLTSITIPDSVTSIDQYAFQYCSGLTSITYIGTIAQWNAITFKNNWNSNTGNYTIHCTDGDIAKDGTITYHNT